MTRSSSRPDARPLVRLDLLLTSAVALMLTALPLGLSTEGPSLSWHAAFARDGGGGNGAGGGGNGQSSGQGGERGYFCRDYREELILAADSGRLYHTACRNDSARWAWL